MGDSWRWQLRDSEGQWVKMGSKVKWLARGKWLHGTVVGSTEPGYATIRPEGGGPSKAIDVRRITVESPATPAQPKSDAGVGRPTRTPKPKGVPAAAKTPPLVEPTYRVRYPRGTDEGEAIAEVPGEPNPVGVLRWNYVEDPPVVVDVSVDERYRRRGIASKLFDLAKSNESRLQHSDSLTTEGAAFREAHEAAPAVEIPAAAKTPKAGIPTDQELIQSEYQGRTGNVPAGMKSWTTVYQSGETKQFTAKDSSTAKRVAREYGQRFMGGDRPLSTSASHGTMEVKAEGATTMTTTAPEWVSENGVATANYKGLRLRVSGTGWDIYDEDGRHIDEGTTEPMRQRHVVALPKGLGEELHFKAREVVQKRADEHAAKRDEKAEVDRRVAETAQESLSAEEITARIDALAPAAKKDPRLANVLMLAKGMLDAGEVEAARGYLARAEVMAGASEPAPVKVKDAQPEAKSPAVQAVEKKALAVKTDTRLAEIYEASLDLKGQQERLAYDIHRSGGSVNTAPKYSGKKVWARSLDEAMTDFDGQTYDRATWERSVAKYQANEQKLDALDKEAGELNTVYLDAGTWTRAFLVTNKGGHVHRSMSCSTCYPTTRFFWLPEYSGSDEDQIVDDAGERACTVCYPSAPVKTLSKPTKIFSDDEKQQAIARQERAASKTAKDAKALNNPDGSDLLVKNHYSVTYPDHLKTDVSAQNWYVKNAADLQAKHAEHIQAEFPITRASLEKILTALAAKHGKTVEEIRAELAPKVAARVKKDAKERAASEAMWQAELKARGL